MALSCSKKSSALFCGITSKHKGDCYCLNCLPFLRTENKVRSHENLSKSKDFCGNVMPSEKDKKLEFNQYIKPDKMSYIIYAGIESLIKKIRWMCKKILQQQKLESIFPVDIQCQLYELLTI